jgi:farnesyl diphosphate synthase
MKTQPPLNFQSWMAATQGRIEAALASRLPASDHLPHRLHSAMRYAALGGGKRVRPLLAIAAGEVTNAPPVPLDVVACSLEMIHVYSLVHDDLPCMDNDVLRRGRPTCHVEYDEPTALLVGDSLQTLAFETLSTPIGINPIQQLEMFRILCHASGSRGMAGGQAIDLESVGLELDQPKLELMHTLKTGALIHAAVILGALCGKTLSPEERSALDYFARRIGLLFQVVDDILDCTESTATLGKTAGKDAQSDKPTYVRVLGLSQAKEMAESLRVDALDSLTVFGKRAERLTQLADFICRRQF